MRFPTGSIKSNRQTNVVCFSLPLSISCSTHHKMLPIGPSIQASLMDTPTTPSILYVQPKPPHLTYPPLPLPLSITYSIQPHEHITKFFLSAHPYKLAWWTLQLHHPFHTSNQNHHIIQPHHLTCPSHHYHCYHFYTTSLVYVLQLPALHGMSSRLVCKVIPAHTTGSSHLWLPANVAY
jgi:hypothetical protein